MLIFLTNKSNSAHLGNSAYNDICGILTLSTIYLVQKTRLSGRKLL